MKGITHYRDAQAAGVSLSPEFIEQVLGKPACSVEQASYSAIALENDRREMLKIDQALARLDFDRRRIEREIKTLRADRALLERAS